MMPILQNHLQQVPPSRVGEIVASVAAEFVLSSSEEHQLYNAVKDIPEDILCAAYIHLRRRHFASLHFLLAALHEFIAPELLRRHNQYQD